MSDALRQKTGVDDGLGKIRDGLFRYVRTYCIDCRARNPMCFWVEPKLWRSAGFLGRAGIICFNCFQTRIGRPLVLADLPRAIPMNEPFHTGWWMRDELCDCVTVKATAQ